MKNKVELKENIVDCSNPFITKNSGLDRYVIAANMIKASIEAVMIDKGIEVNTENLRIFSKKSLE